MYTYAKIIIQPTMIETEINPFLDKHIVSAIKGTPIILLRSKKIGDGTFSIVYSAILTSETETRNVAVKVGKVIPGEIICTSIIRDITMLIKIKKHTNIVEMLDYFCYKNTFVGLIMPLARTTLYSYVTNECKSINGRKMSPEKVIDMTLQLINGLKHLYSYYILVGDLKPDNILLEIDGDNITYKICDFSLIRYANIWFNNYNSRRIFITRYRPPEVIYGNNYTEKSDI